VLYRLQTKYQAQVSLLTLKYILQVGITLASSTTAGSFALRARVEPLVKNSTPPSLEVGVPVVSKASTTSYYWPCAKDIEPIVDTDLRTRRIPIHERATITLLLLSLRIQLTFKQNTETIFGIRPPLGLSSSNNFLYPTLCAKGML
jgi:hypothetical protein